MAQRASQTHWAVGDRVRFTEAWDIYPHVDVREGEWGTITHFDMFAQHEDDEFLKVKMDEYHDALDDWDNEVIFYNADMFTYPLRAGLLDVWPPSSAPHPSAPDDDEGLEIDWG
jgi:hypothetical protein